MEDSHPRASGERVTLAADAVAAVAASAKMTRMVLLGVEGRAVVGCWLDGRTNEGCMNTQKNKNKNKNKNKAKTSRKEQEPTTKGRLVREAPRTSKAGANANV